MSTTEQEILANGHAPSRVLTVRDLDLIRHGLAALGARALRVIALLAVTGLFAWGLALCTTDAGRIVSNAVYALFVFALWIKEIK